MQSSYVFEAKSVQSYILAGGRLRDVVGGSALLDRVTSTDSESSFLALLQKKFEIENFQRAAGGSVSLVFSQDTNAKKAREFRALWQLHIAIELPGLSYADGIGTGDTAQAATENALKAARSAVNDGQAELPQAIPLMAQSQRMAAPACFVADRVGTDGRCKITRERADYGTLAKRHFLKRSEPGKDPLGMRLAAGTPHYSWPNEFEAPEDTNENAIAFPFPVNEDQEVAIVHADGDGIGAKILTSLKKPYNGRDLGEEIRSISDKLSQASRDAAIAATRETLLAEADKRDSTIVAARPVLLGGDDLTMIIRADLALDFLRRYCSAFQAETRTSFADFPSDHPFREGVAASGAAVFIKARQPFSKALKLTEALTSYAKQENCGHISFFRCTTSKIPSTVEEAWPANELRPGPYDERRFECLMKLVSILREPEIGVGSLRKMLDVESAFFASALDRTLKVMDKSGDSQTEPPSERLKAALEAYGAPIDGGDPNALKIAFREAFILRRLGY